MARREYELKKEDEIRNLKEELDIKASVATTPIAIRKHLKGASRQPSSRIPTGVNSGEPGAEARERHEEAPSAKKQVEDKDEQDEVLNDLLAEYTTLFDTPAPRHLTPPQGQGREMA